MQAAEERRLATCKLLVDMQALQQGDGQAAMSDLKVCWGDFVDVAWGRDAEEVLVLGCWNWSACEQVVLCGIMVGLGGTVG